MAQRKTLSEAQIALLLWIHDGCPDGVYEEVHHRISAAALVRRDLVTVAGRGSSWSATVTDAGRAYLAKVRSPNPPVPRQANLSVTEQLVADVIAAGGSIRVQRRRWDEPGVDWEQRVRHAIRHNKVPAGKELKFVPHYDEDTAEVRLVDVPEGATPVLLPVPVAERVARYHRLVAKVRNDKSRLELSDAALPRASRILHALVTEAETRGHEVTVPKGHQNRNDFKLEWSSTTDGHLAISAAGHTVALRIHEEGLRVRAMYRPPPPTPGDPWGTRGTGTYRYVRDDTKATGRLTIAIVPEQYRTKRAASWSDRKRWALEDKLPDVLAEIAVRVAEAEHARLEDERKAAARKVAWEAAMVEAKERHHQARCAEALYEQLARWEQATRIRAYCDQVDAAHPCHPDTLEWTRWARGHAEGLDPIGVPPLTPTQLDKVSAEDLRPHLDGWSPYGHDDR